MSTILEGEAFKHYILYSKTGIGVESTVPSDVKEKLYTSLAYDELYGNKPSRLYNTIEEYSNADVLTNFGIPLDKYMELSPVEASILLDISYNIRKEKEKTDTALANKIGGLKHE